MHQKTSLGISLATVHCSGSSVSYEFQTEWLPLVPETVARSSRTTTSDIWPNAIERSLSTHLHELQLALQLFVRSLVWQCVWPGIIIINIRMITVVECFPLKISLGVCICSHLPHPGVGLEWIIQGWCCSSVHALCPEGCIEPHLKKSAEIRWDIFRAETGRQDKIWGIRDHVQFACSVRVCSCTKGGVMVSSILGENRHLLQMQVCAEPRSFQKASCDQHIMPNLSFCRPTLPHHEGLVMISNVPSCCHWRAATYRPLKWLSRWYSTFHCEFLNMVLCCVVWNSHLSDLTFLAPSAFECPSAWI